MRHLIVFFLLTSIAGKAQQTHIFKIDSLPPSGVLLDKNWKFHVGDNPDFAKPDFDDRAWESIDPTKDIFDLPQLPKTGQIVWFRLRLSLDSAINYPLVLLIQQSGASEIYLNDKLIKRFGMLSENAHQIKAFNPLDKPIVLPVNKKDTMQVLSVRYALQPNISYTTNYGNNNTGITVQLFSSENGIEVYHQNNIFQLTPTSKEVGIFGILGVLFFSLYLFFPTRKVNLYFSIYLIGLAVEGSIILYQMDRHAVEQWYYIQNFNLSLQVNSYLFMLLAVYTILEQKRKYFFWCMVLLGVVCIPSGLFIYGYGWLLFGVAFTNLINIDITRVAIIALKNKKKGAWIVALGSIVCIVFWFAFTLQNNKIFHYNGWFNFLDISFLSIPTTFAIFLAYNSGITNRTLQLKLDEVEKLSEEKQQILSTQNETLEKQVKERTVELEDKNKDLEIEAALERVRSRTMAMHKSDELADVSFILDSQVRALGIKTRGCAFNIYGNNESTEWFSSETGTMPTYKTPKENVFLRYYEEGQKGNQIYIESFEGDACIAHYDYLCTLPVAGESLKKYKESGSSFPTKQIDHVVYFKYGYLLFITLELVPEAHDIFKRFAKVFEQTYTRFLDLQKVEAQTREAQIELSLEKVRSRSMAMHKSNELAEAASVLFQQIKEIGFEMWSCGFCIWKQDDFSELWMSADSGGLLPPMLMPYKEDPTHRKIYEASLRQEPIHEYVWEGEELEKHYEFLYTIPSAKEAIDILKKSGLSLPVKQCYYVGFFKQGYLLIITKEPAPDMHELSYRFTRVFEQTYTRFLDLQKAEQLTEQTKLDLIQIQTEKNRAENALTELQATQNQLIQKEKLASLGELTAGIAHEIQNPLNFVNNFSELSVDLTKDLNTEIIKKPIDEAYVKELMHDLTGNQEKINFHGKRAASIVSGMLEHSRVSTGKKELTDINKLADEYFRLSYHGLRAKNKDFNAEMITYFDTTILKIEIIPQDVGRVILNLINNAFYAVNEKRILDNGQRTTDDRNKNIYAPTVTVSTLKTENAIEIRVKDNGIGMPKNVREKIFQPFFTTKPTGQGTGLGLSLAYDIITKGHGGTLKVESTEGAGSEFVIRLLLTI